MISYKKLEELVRKAYLEGYDDCYMDANEGKEPEDCFQFSPDWENSIVREQLLKHKGK